MSENGPRYQPKERRKLPSKSEADAGYRSKPTGRPVVPARPEIARPRPRFDLDNSAPLSKHGTRIHRARKVFMPDADEVPIVKTREVPQEARPEPPRPTIRFASTVPRTSSWVTHSFGYNVRANLNIGRIFSLLCLIALLGVTYWLLNSPNFLVTQVTVSGGHFLDVSGVMAQTGVDKINVFLLDENAIADKLKQLPFVLDAKVEKALPNQLSVSVIERQEAVNWKVGSTNYLVDRDGVVLQVLSSLPADAASFPAINSTNSAAMKLGDKVDTVAVQSAGPILTRFSQSGLPVASLDFSPFNGLTVISKDGKWKALLGSDAELDKKINILKGLLADSNLKWTFVDLRSTARPAVQ